jgi:hypothetical protein
MAGWGSRSTTSLDSFIYATFVPIAVKLPNLKIFFYSINFYKNILHDSKTAYVATRQIAKSTTIKFNTLRNH